MLYQQMRLLPLDNFTLTKRLLYVVFHNYYKQVQPSAALSSLRTLLRCVSLWTVLYIGSVLPRFRGL